MKTLSSINPYNSKQVGVYPAHSFSEIKKIIQQAHLQFKVWSYTTFSERASILKNVAGLLKKNKEEYAKTISLEMGKPISQAIAEVEKCAWVCEYYADNAARFLRSKKIKTEAESSFVRYEPLGVVLAVMPWNYPFWQVFRFAAPALMAGNTVVLKHASNVSGSALLLQKIFHEGGLPKFGFNTLLAGSDLVKKIIAHPSIAAVTLTGSSKAGSSVAQEAGKNIKKTVLELGGSNALIVLADADIEKTAELCVTARFQNTGQSCIAGKRLLVDQSIADNFIQVLSQKVSKLKSGNPADRNTYIGVMAREDLAVELENQLKKSMEMGAKVLLGGKRNKAYFEPTLVGEVTPDMPVFKEETFGPLLVITRFKTLGEAIYLSNLSNYGLGVSFFTKNVKKIMPYISRMHEGAVFINDFVKSDPRLPFGGVKQSGYGRELGEVGIKEFVNVKTVVINNL